MPKINVYLPDDLAATVKAADLPVSAICQKALREAAALVGAARKAAAALGNPEFDPDAHPGFAERLTGRMTERLRRALQLGRGAAEDPGRVDSGHLLTGLLDTPDNLAVRLLDSLQITAGDLRQALALADRAEDLPQIPREDGDASPSLWSGLTLPARSAIGAALEVSIDLGHNYLGCEHLLIGLADERAGAAGTVLRDAGLTPASLKAAVTSAVAGFAHAQQATTAERSDAAQALSAIMTRLDRIEERLTAADL